MAVLKKNEKTAELMRIIYEDSDVTIATSDPDKILLNFVKCDTGIVGEINVRKKRAQPSYITLNSSEEWNTANFEKLCGSPINRVTSATAFGSPSASVAKTISQHTMSSSHSRVLPAAKSLDNEIVQVNEKLTQESIEVQQCVHSHVSLSTEGCSSVHSMVLHQPIEEPSCFGHPTSSAESVKTKTGEMRTTSGEVQQCDHPNHKNPSDQNSPPTGVQEKPKLQFSLRKSKSAIELTTPIKELISESAVCFNEPEKIDEHPSSAAVDKAAKSMRATDKGNTKRKRAKVRRPNLQARDQSSSESDGSHRIRMTSKRRRRTQMNRRNAIQVVVKQEVKKAQVHNPKLEVGILQCGSSQWEIIRRKDMAEATSNSVSCQSTTIKRITARMEKTPIMRQKKSMDEVQLTADKAPSAEEMLQDSKEKLERGTDKEEQAMKVQLTADKAPSAEEMLQDSKEKLERGTDKEEQAMKVQLTADKAPSAEEMLQDSKEKLERGTDNEEQAMKAEAAARVSAKNSYVSRGKQELELAEGENLADTIAEELSSMDISDQKAEEDRGSFSAAKPVPEASSSIVTQENLHTDVDVETEDDQCGDRTFDRFYKRRMDQDQAEDLMAYESESSLTQSSMEMLPECEYQEVCLGAPSKSLFGKAKFIHMDTEDDTEVEEGNEVEEQEQETEAEKMDEHEKEEAESVATSSIDLGCHCPLFRQPSTCSFPNPSYVSVVESTSGKDYSSVISPTASTCFSDTNTKSVTTDHCHYYDAFSESCYDIHQVQLLMENLNKTGFLVNSVSDSEIPETPSKNALTGTWRNSVHRPKWDETVDLCLVCGNQEFYVHRLVVVHYSRKLCRLLCKHILKPGLAVEVIGINPLALHTVIDWMYTLEINIQKDNVLDVFMAAICLDVKKLQVRCIDKMHDIVTDARTEDYRHIDAQTSSRSVDINKRRNIVFRKRAKSKVSQQQSTDVTDHRQGNATNYERSETPEIPSLRLRSKAKFYDVNYDIGQPDSRSGEVRKGSASTGTTGSSSIKSANKWTRGETSDNRSTASWTPKQSSVKIVFQATNGQEVSSAPLGKHCLVEKKVLLTKNWQQNNLHSPSTNSAWSHDDEPALVDDFDGMMENLGAIEDTEVMSENSYTFPDKITEPGTERNGSRRSSVSIHASYSTFSGSQNSLPDRFSQRLSREASGNYGLDNSSSFSFEERPVPPVPSCKNVMVCTDQTQLACDQNDLTEVVTIKKANTTIITNFKKGNPTDQGIQARISSVREMLTGAENAIHGHDINVVAPVQINKPAKLMQTYTLAMPKNFNTDRVLLFGGLSRPDKTDFDEAAHTVHCYDVTSGKYDRLGKLPTPLFDAAACCYENGVYLTGGISQKSITLKCPGKATKDVWYLDLINPIWQKRSDMRQPRAGHCLVNLGDKLYAIGGAEDSEGSRVTQTVEAYRPRDDTWTAVHPLPVPLWRMGAACFNGAIWLCGGFTEPIQVKTNEIFIYCPERDSWFKHGSRLLKKVAMASLVDAQGKLILVGGLSGSREDDALEGCALDALDMYNNEKQEWNTVANMSDPRFIPSVVALGDQIVIIGGRNSRFSPPLNSVEIYGKKGDGWVHRVKALPLPLSNSAAVGLPNFRRGRL